MKWECKGCRQKRTLVAHIKGMGFCEDCKDKMPTQKSFHDFIHPDWRESVAGVKAQRRTKYGSRDDLGKE